MQIVIINGPNLNLLGKREPTLYGTQSFEDYLVALKKKYLDHDIIYFQSNIEGEIINEIQAHGFTSKVIILNASAYTHTSIAIADAIKSITTPVIEVHISNVYAREDYRKKSYIAPVCVASLCGFGLKGYDLAIQYATTTYL